MKAFFFFIFFSAGAFLMQGQQKISFKDSLDHKIDLSDWVISANGFIPVPIIITEPALGGFGGLLAAAFVKPQTPYLDTIMVS